MTSPLDLRGGGAPTATPPHPLDNAVRAALPDPRDPAAWPDPHTLAGPGTTVRIKPVDSVPDRREITGGGEGVQLAATEEFRTGPAPEAVRLGPGDVTEIPDLVARTRPSPFLRRTVLLGTRLGIRHRGRLVPLAGERSGMGLHPAEGRGSLRRTGWTEISAVCTDPEHRGRGLATRLVRAVGHGIRERGDTPFPHAAADNAPAIRLYASPGFRLRRRSAIVSVRTPGTSREAGAL
ncbi:GNAT family N-acetyltransferase [Streptomyces sp. NBC_00582]|uniref:GNAT family N-acetyltransferase n=1 Tax=Streptomyces sp. NBC_00582 TaxID=2975783 RepID=UPI002E7FE08A|nr:GNAT family N-acetyltransferase [Streptomyces sp. NBC_00582]WUB60272.1 GNAT family N-acetyltransferase [Streptomyces sp. NBC_00582]